MRTITKKKAIEIARRWHGGQWSALYQYASSGEFVKERSVEYIKECVDCKYPSKNNVVHPKYKIKELDQLIRYFIKEAAGHDITIRATKHSGHEIIWVDIPEMEEPNGTV